MPSQPYTMRQFIAIFCPNLQRVVEELENRIGDLSKRSPPRVAKLLSLELGVPVHPKDAMRTLERPDWAARDYKS